MQAPSLSPLTLAPLPPAGPAEAAAAHSRSRLALALQATVLSHEHAPQAAVAFASELAVALGCTRVTVGFVERGHARIQAASHGAATSWVGEVFDAIAAAMDEAIAQRATVRLPGGQAPAGIVLAHSRLLQRQGGALATIPLLSLGRIAGAVMLEWAAPPPAGAPVIAQAEDAVALVGPVLHLMHRAELPPRERMRLALRRLREKLHAPEGRRLRIGLAAAALGVAALALVPVEHRIGGRARIEGEHQRALVAPVAGFLAAAHARPGDRVKQGALLVELADQDLQLQQRKSASELAQQENAYSTSLVRADRAAAMIAFAKAEEARAQLALIDAELQRSRIVAPFDGVVIQGDLSQAIGAPVERGQTLMLVAPAERYRVVVDIDERDIANVQVGQAGLLALSALPWDGMPVKVARVDPMARSVEGSNVFAVEAEIEGAGRDVRPGLEGVAKIAVGRQPIAWTAWQRFSRWARAAAWRWLP